MESTTPKRILSFDEFVSQGETGMEAMPMPAMMPGAEQPELGMPGAEEAPAPAETPMLPPAGDDNQLMMMDEPSHAEAPEMPAKPEENPIQ